MEVMRAMFTSGAITGISVLLHLHFCHHCLLLPYGPRRLGSGWMGQGLGPSKKQK